MLKFYNSINGLTKEIEELKSKSEVLNETVLMNNKIISAPDKYNRGVYKILMDFNTNLTTYKANDINCMISILNCIEADFNIMSDFVTSFEYVDIFNRIDSRDCLEVNADFKKTNGVLFVSNNTLSNSYTDLVWEGDYLISTTSSKVYKSVIPNMMSLTAEEQIYLLSLVVINELSTGSHFTDYSPQDITAIYNFCSLRIEDTLFSVNTEFIDNTILDISKDSIIVTYDKYLHVVNKSLHNIYPISFYTLPTDVLYSISNIYQSILVNGDLNCSCVGF